MARLRYLENAREGDKGTVCTHDNKLFFDNTSAYIQATASGQLNLVADKVTITGNLEVSGTTSFDAIHVAFNQNLLEEFTVGDSDNGYDVQFYGDNVSYYWLWDASKDTNKGGVTMIGSFGITGDMDIDGDTTMTGTLDIEDTITLTTTATDGVKFSASYTNFIDFNDVGTTSSIALHFVDAFLGKIIETGTYASSAGTGITLASGNYRPVSFLFDDNSANLTAQNYRGVLSRIYLSVNQSNQKSIRAMQGHIKLADGVDLTIGQEYFGAVNGVEGYIETSGATASDIGANTRVAAVHGYVEIRQATTVASGGILAGVFAELGMNSSISGESAGVWIDIVDSAHGWSGKWTNGILIADDATSTGIDIGTTAIGINFTGAYTTGAILIDVTFAQHTDYAIKIAGTTANTGGCNNPLYVSSIPSASGVIARAAEFLLAPSEKMGDYGNAVKAYLDLDSNGSSGGAGLLSGLCAEVKLPGETMTGTIAVLELELVAPSSFVSTSGTGQNCVSFIHTNLKKADQHGEINDHGYFLNIQGLTSGTDKLLYNNTLKCVIDSTEMFLLFSTVGSSFTTAYPIVASQDTGATANANGIYETLTINDTVSNSVSGIRCLVTTDGTNRTPMNIFGGNFAVRLKNTGDYAGGLLAGIQVSVDMGLATQAKIWAYGINIDFTEIATRATAPAAFIGFQDFDYLGGKHCPILFDIGRSGSIISTDTEGDLVFGNTLHLLVNTVDMYIPLSTVEGTFTSAYPVVLTNATALGITSTIAAEYTYPFFVKSTLADTITSGIHSGVYIRTTIAANTDMSDGAVHGIKAILRIYGSGSTTALSANGGFSGISAEYFTDNADIDVTAGIHSGLSGSTCVGSTYTLTADAELCCIAAMDASHADAEIPATNYSGVYIAGHSNQNMGNAIKVGGNVTNFLEIPDTETIAGYDTNYANEKKPDGWIKMSIGGNTCYIWTYTNKA